MPNKKLKQRLASRASAVQQLLIQHPKAHAGHIGQKVYATIKGSYGKTINPYPKLSINSREFRKGFEGAKQLAKLLISPNKIKELPHE